MDFDKLQEKVSHLEKSVAGVKKGDAAIMRDFALGLKEVLSVFLKDRKAGVVVKKDTAIHKQMGKLVPFAEASDIKADGKVSVWVDEKTKNLTASFLLHLRGGPKVAVIFDKGVLRLDAKPPRRVDCHIFAEPVALFLVAMGLKKQWGPIATGKLMTWGTKPWLALQFVGFFATP